VTPRPKRKRRTVADKAPTVEIEKATGAPVTVDTLTKDLVGCHMITDVQHASLVENVRYLAQIAAVARMFLDAYDEDGDLFNRGLLADLRAALDGRRLQ